MVIGSTCLMNPEFEYYTGPPNCVHYRVCPEQLIKFEGVIQSVFFIHHMS